jgi:diguanylate cyclase
MDDVLGRALRERQDSGAPLALMFIDLDDFKRANDLGGHRTGDEILVAVARALTSLAAAHPPCSTGGRITSARLGGDEFAVLCRGLDTQEAGTMAQRIIDTVARMRFTAGPHTLQVGCSIGVAGCPQDCDDDPAELVACADAAMYRAKQQGKNRWARRDDAAAPDPSPTATQTRSTISAMP